MQRVPHLDRQMLSCSVQELQAGDASPDHVPCGAIARLFGVPADGVAVLVDVSQQPLDVHEQIGWSHSV